MTWPMVELGELVTIKGGGTPSKSIDAYWDGDVPWASVKDFKSRYISQTQDCITQAGVENSATNIIPEGVIIIPTRMALGKVAITACDMAINQDLKALFINDECTLDRNYLARYLESKANYIESEGKGATVKGITLDFLKSIKVLLPPLAEQKRIATILDKADAIRQKRQQAITLADQFLRSVFLDMFGDPVTNPKEWDKRPLHEIASHIVDCPHSTPKWTDEGIIALRTSNLTKGGWDWTDKRFVSELEYKERTKRSELVAKDLILSREGTVGIAALVPEGVKMCMGQRLVQIRANDNHIMPEYLLYLILIELEPDRISRLMTGSTSKHINISDLKALSIMLPPLAIQNKFVETMTFLNGIKERLALFDVDSNMAFDAISQKAFSGQL